MIKQIPCQRNKYKSRRSSTPLYEIDKLARCFPLPIKSQSVITIENDEFGEGRSYKVGDTENEENPMLVLSNWIKTQKFISQDLSEDFLGIFLWAADWNADLASKLLQKYFYLRQEPSPLFRNRDPLCPVNQKILKKVYVLPLKPMTQDGRKIILTGLLKPLVNYDQMEQLKLLLMVIDLLIWENNFGYGDFSIVFDARDFQCPQLLENKVRNGKTIGSCLTDSIPGELKSFYFYQPPPYIAKTVESRNGIWITVVHNEEELIQHIGAEILPKEFGGTLGPFKDLLKKWLSHLAENQQFFVSFEKQMVYDYQRKTCFKQQQAKKGKNWVQEMKLEADEWDYKIKYYERMKSMKPLKHPAFGTQRLNSISVATRAKKPPNGLNKVKKQARDEFLFPEAEQRLMLKEMYVSEEKEKTPSAECLLELYIFC